MIELDDSSTELLTSPDEHCSSALSVKEREFCALRQVGILCLVSSAMLAYN